MGQLLKIFKKSIVEDFLNSINSNAAVYYAFASNPVPTDDDPVNTADDYSNINRSNWNLLFGKRISNTDIFAVTKHISWTSNTVYDKYDDTATDLDTAEYFVAVTTSPSEPRHVFKCLDNANGAPSTYTPDLVQATSFTKADGYMWRYMYSISDSNFEKFATEDYIPLMPNTVIQAVAPNYTGVEVVKITNAGSGYVSYHDGIVRAVVNTTLMQVENEAISINDFYTRNGIYFYNTIEPTSQLRYITDYVANVSGNWVYLNEAANTELVVPGITNYKISPRVVFDTDGTEQPSAYSIVNTTTDTIESIVMLNIGNGINRANATIQSNTIYGSGATLHCIVPPPGGHGFDPSSELGVEGIVITFSFNEDELNTIQTDISYNKVGIYKDPYGLVDNNTKGPKYYDLTFDQLLHATLSPTIELANNEIITGLTSGAQGLIVKREINMLSMVGDKNFANGETIVSANGDLSSTINVGAIGDIYTKDLTPLYVKNIADVYRANNQVESFKLVIKI